MINAVTSVSSSTGAVHPLPLDEAANRRMVSFMSRYEFVPPGWSATFSFAIGWDVPLDTFFAQVIDTSISEDDDRVIVWVGAMPPYYRDLDAMLWEVNGRIAGRLPAVALLGDMRATLIKDRDRSAQASPRNRTARKRMPVFALDLFPPETT
jgi:hypothetical protein